MCGPHTGLAVFDDHTRGRHNAHLRRRVEEEIRLRLATGNVARAEDPPCESLVQAGQPERQAHLLVASIRCDAHRDRDRVEGLDHTVDRSQLADERVTVEQLGFLFPRALRSIPLVRPNVLGVRSRLADVPFDDLRFRQRMAESLEDSRHDADRDPFAVDQDAVAVENHQLDRIAHRRRIAVRSNSRSRSLPRPLRFVPESSNICSMIATPSLPLDLRHSLLRT